LTLASERTGISDHNRIAETDLEMAFNRALLVGACKDMSAARVVEAR
jgi:hypothetical protein